MAEFPDSNLNDNFLKNQSEFNNENTLAIENNASSLTNELTLTKPNCYANISAAPNVISDTNIIFDNLLTPDIENTNVSNSDTTSAQSATTTIEIKFAKKNDSQNEQASKKEINNSNFYISELTVNDIAELLNSTSSENNAEKAITMETLDLPISINLNENISTNIEKDKTITNSEVIETIELQPEFVEKIKEIEKLIEDELIEEIDNSPKIEKEPQKASSPSNSSNKNVLNQESYNEKLYKIENAIGNNRTLLISERLGKIYLPYQISELENYIEKNPNLYNSLQDVVKEKYTLPFDFFKNQSLKSRFSETYNLLKNKNGENFMKSVSYAFKISGKRNLNPTIIASCKNKYELDSYIYYLDSNTLSNFRFFDIIYEVTPLKK